VGGTIALPLECGLLGIRIDEEHLPLLTGEERREVRRHRRFAGPTLLIHHRKNRHRPPFPGHDEKPLANRQVFGHCTALKQTLKQA
jgi:hypothetical protein